MEVAALEHLKLFTLYSKNSQVTEPFIKSRMSSNFGQIRTLAVEFADLECLKNIPKSSNGKVMYSCYM